LIWSSDSTYAIHSIVIVAVGIDTHSYSEKKKPQKLIKRERESSIDIYEEMQLVNVNIVDEIYDIKHFFNNYVSENTISKPIPIPKVKQKEYVYGYSFYQ
jgi:hypothetical protein